ncbi:hypothetical protein bcgnr5390_49050 [Bacillus luti]
MLCIYKRMELLDIMKQLYHNCFLLWAEKGEFHETSTEHGLTAIVMEAENLEQAIVMPIIQGGVVKNDN